MDKTKRGAIMALLKACREWKSNAYDIGAEERLDRAVQAVEDVTIEHLDGPGVPDHVALHGEDLEAFLDSVTHMGRDRTLVHALELKLDQEGLHVRINGRGGWSSGLGEPRGSQ